MARARETYRATQKNALKAVRKFIREEVRKKND